VDALIAQYGYAGVLLGAFLDSPTVLVLAGFAGARGYLDPGPALAAALAGGFASGYVKFLIGRRWGAALLSRHPAWRPGAERVDALLTRHPLAILLAFRFLYGLRAATPLMLGAGAMRLRRFLALNAAGAALWVGLFTAAGYFFGSAAQLLVARAGRHDLGLMAGIVIVGVGARLLYLAAQARRAPA
jgi:membrane protein DedA with SNARE-associated domain